MNIEKNILAERLTLLRKQKNLSQYKLAEILGFSRGLIANYEQGRREPDYNTLLTFATFYNVTIDYILGRTNDQSVDFTPSKAEFALIQNFNNLTSESQEELSRYIELLKIKDSVNNEQRKKLSVSKKEG